MHYPAKGWSGRWKIHHDAELDSCSIQRGKSSRRNAFVAPTPRDLSITIRDGSITFNTACIKGLEGVIYIKLQISESLGKLTAERCDENDKNALRWCVAKDGKRKSRTMNCRPFTDLIYKTMGWDIIKRRRRCASWNDWHSNGNKNNREILIHCESVSAAASGADCFGQGRKNKECSIQTQMMIQRQKMGRFWKMGRIRAKNGKKKWKWEE